MKPLACGIWTDLRAPSRMLSTGRNCSPATATAVTPTSPPSTAATSPLHHGCCTRIAVSSSLLVLVLVPPPQSRWWQTRPVYRRVNNGQMLRTALRQGTGRETYAHSRACAIICYTPCARQAACDPCGGTRTPRQGCPCRCALRVREWSDWGLYWKARQAAMARLWEANQR